MEEETTKEKKKHTYGVQKEQVGFFLSVAHVNKFPGGKPVSCRDSKSENSWRSLK